MLFELLDYYRKNHKDARAIAVSGYLHVLKYHRAVNLMDYILRTVHYYQAKLEGHATLPTYQETGFDMRNEALYFSKKIKSDST